MQGMVSLSEVGRAYLRRQMEWTPRVMMMWRAWWMWNLEMRVRNVVSLMGRLLSFAGFGW